MGLWGHKAARFQGSKSPRLGYRWPMARLTKPERVPDEAREKVSIYLPSELAQDLRIAAVKQRRTISAVAEQMIRDGLASAKEGK
jgi:hypothetical protein